LKKRALTIFDRLRVKLHEVSIRVGLRVVYFRYIQKWVLLGAIIGIMGGLGTAIFYWLLDLSTIFFLSIIPANLGNSWIIVLIPALGGLIAGPIIYLLAPEAEGHGTDAVISAYHKHWGSIRARVPIIKTVASSITIGSGGSAGREGPVAQIGGGLSSLLAKILNLEIPDRRIMVATGVAAGIGSIFKAPLGAAFFGVEVLYRRDFEVEALIPAIIASVVGYSIFALIFGWETMFETPYYTFRDPLELVFFGILGFICAFIAILYVKIFYGVRNLFQKLPLPSMFKPSLGGLAVGVIALLFPQILGMGYNHIQATFSAQIPLMLMVMLVFAKILATSFTIGSGGSGGVFAPSLYIGAMLGGVLGQIFYIFFPEIVTQPEIFALVGMAAFFAGAAKVPIASIIMVSEMTGGYSLLVPLMLASAISYALSGEASIYESQQDRRESF